MGGRRGEPWRLIRRRTAPLFLCLFASSGRRWRRRRKRRLALRPPARRHHGGKWAAAGVTSNGMGSGSAIGVSEKTFLAAPWAGGAGVRRPGVPLAYMASRLAALPISLVRLALCNRMAAAGASLARAAASPYAACRLSALCSIRGVVGAHAAAATSLARYLSAARRQHRIAHQWRCVAVRGREDKTEGAVGRVEGEGEGHRASRRLTVKYRKWRRRRGEERHSSGEEMVATEIRRNLRRDGRGERRNRSLLAA